MLAAGAASGWGPTASTNPISNQFFIEAEDFDFDGGRHKPEADAPGYAGGAYQGLSAVPGVDYHDPGANENAEYRSASQGVGLTRSFDPYRDGYEMAQNFRIGWNEAGDWFNYTRSFPSPALEYHVYARLSSAGLSNAVRLDRVVAGVGTTNQTLAPVGEARGPASGGWGTFVWVPFRDAGGQLARVILGGTQTLRLTVLPDSNQDIEHLQFVPVTSVQATPCAAPTEGLVARWRGEGNPNDSHAGTFSELHNGAGFTSGKVGQAFEFNGINQFVGTTLDVQPSALPTTTWEGWIFPRSTLGRQQILSADDGGFDRSVGIEQGRYLSVFVGDSVWKAADASFNQWQHIAVVYSPTNVLFYKNGVRTALGRPAPGQGSRFAFQIGRNPGFGEYFRGLVDELSIYNRALSDAEIQAIACPLDFSSGTPPKPAIAVAPEVLDFGVVTNGQSKQLTLTLSNTGLATLNVTRISTDDPQFMEPNPAGPLSIEPGRQVNITIRFAPTTLGTNTAALVIASNIPAQPALTLPLRGIGVRAECPTISLLPESLPPGRAGASYEQTLAASGGKGAPTFALSVGALPEGMTLSQAGLLSGKPLAPGTTSFSVRVSDADGCSVTSQYALVVSSMPISSPLIREVDPPRGAPGSTVRILGSNLGTDSSAARVWFDRVSAAVAFRAPDRLEAIVPADLPSGAAGVTVHVRGESSNVAVFEVERGESGARTLSIRKEANQEVIVSWPAALANATLQFTDDFSAPWTASQRTPDRTASEFALRENPSASQRRFYRLAGSGSGPLSPLNLPDDWMPQFPVSDSVRVTVRAATGGTLRLKDGATVQIPARALAADQEVSLLKLDLSPFQEGSPRPIYQVQPDHLQLAAPATVVLPYQKTPGVLPSDIHVFRTGAADGTKELAAQVDEAAGVVRFATEHFSFLVVEDDRSYLEIYAEAVSSTFSRMLPVPYYSQSDSFWCFAAASQMLLKHYGRDAEIWDVARYFNVSATQGAKLWRLWAGHYTDFFRSYGLEVLGTSGWVLAARANGYIIQQLKAGRPVMVIVEASHAVVVVGYNREGIFVHDPSGASILSATGQRPNRSKLAAHHFTWEQWKAAMFPNVGSFTLPLPVWTVVIAGSADAPEPPATMSLNLPLLSGNEELRASDGDLEIDRLNLEAHLAWDGRFPEGYWLFPNKGFFPRNAANSDTMLLRVHAHNAAEESVAATFRVELAGKTILTSETQQIPARTTSWEVPLFASGSPYKFKTGEAGVLFPGSHTLSVAMRAGGRLVDTISVLLEVGPAKPEGLRFLHVPNGTKLSWEANPEEAFTQLQYVVYAHGVPVGTTAGREFTHLTSSREIEYRIAAQHEPTKLFGPFSEPAKSATTRYIRGDPIVRNTSSGLQTSDLRYDGTQAFTTDTAAQIPYPEPDRNSMLRLFWNQPPAEVQLRVPFTFEIKTEAVNVYPHPYPQHIGERFAQVNARFFAPPDPFDPNGAFIGYQETTSCPGLPGPACYVVIQKPHSQVVTITPESSEIKLYLRFMTRKSVAEYQFRNGGIITAEIIWPYAPAP